MNVYLGQHDLERAPMERAFQSLGLPYAQVEMSEADFIWGWQRAAGLLAFNPPNTFITLV